MLINIISITFFSIRVTLTVSSNVAFDVLGQHGISEGQHKLVVHNFIGELLWTNVNFTIELVGMTTSILPGGALVPF